MKRNTDGLTKPKWRNTPTVAIRVPSVFREQILAYARELDSKDAQAGDLESSG